MIRPAAAKGNGGAERGRRARVVVLAFLLGALIPLWSRLLMTVPAAAVAPSPLPTAAELAGHLHVRSTADVRRLRKAALQALFGGAALPTGEPAAERIAAPYSTVREAVRFPGDGYYLTNLHPNGKLAIYHAGHEQRVLREGATTVKAMLAAGYDVLALSMPPTPHERYGSLRPFLEPVALAINYATHRERYDEVIMAGLSGGGWTTVVYAALDSRIDRSYPIAGSLPFPLRTEAKDTGDFEQQLPGLPVNYLDLYVMASSEGRQQVQIFNLQDPCCFAGTKTLLYRNLVIKRSADLGGDFDLLIVSSDEHSLHSALSRLMFTRPAGKFGRPPESVR